MQEKIKIIPMKIHKTVATTAAPFGSDMHQIVCGLGLRPRTHWGSLQRSPDPLARLRGPASKGRRGEGREGGRRGGEGKGKERGVCSPNVHQCPPNYLMLATRLCQPDGRLS